MSVSARVAAVDLGKSRAKLVVATFDRGTPTIVSRQVRVHEGRPLDVFADWYRREHIADCTALAATGLHADEIVEPALSRLPEEACLEAALGLRGDLSGPLNLVSVGARGYSVLTRDARGRIQHIENDKCSSGTGETILKTAARFGLSLADADRVAAAATSAVAITARCSVFAKSEMTHFGNQGMPVDRLFRGYFDSIARYVAALLGRIRADGPVYLIGGGSQLETLRLCLSEHAGSDVRVPDDALLFEAIGALGIAAEQRHTGALPQAPDALIHPKRRRIEVLEPARGWAHRVTRQVAEPIAAGAATEPAVLGLDLGSTGSKAALVSIASGELVLDVYDRTRGNPVDATQRLIRRLLDAVKPDIRAIGVTGSGREAAATVLRAAFPDLGSRIIVENEIVAHATAAIRCDPEGGRSLSVVEIGGQDAKFIQIAGGRIVESDMNKACSAGTGSFLEEQAVFYGVSDIGDFTRRAEQATRPPDLGQTCTVFVADAAAEAHREGFSVEDLFAGFQYSVIHNYLDRVMGQRTLGERVFFQGKPASGASLAWTLAAVSGREVVVPPNPGAMGAWGIGLCALAALDRFETPFNLAAVLDAQVVERADFRCRDSRCATLCNIDRTTVRVGDARHTVLSGGACPKFEVATATRPKLPLDAPSAFDERERLIERYAADRPGDSVVAVPLVGSLAGWLPWVTTFLAELGLGVRVRRSLPRSLSRGEELCYAYDSCAPAKVAHAAIDVDESVLFFPKLLGLPDRDGPCGTTCATEQAMPDLVAGAARDQGRELRVVAPAIPLADGLTSPGVVLALGRAARELGADPVRAVHAAFRAAEAQRDYERELADIGRRTLSYGLPVVVVCGSLHVIHDAVINAGIPAILRQNGALALPMDCYPVPAHVDALPRVPWTDARRALRVALSARERADAFPLLLSSFGCGPASFVEQVFSLLMRDYPHTSLESDGHGGAAGYVTRIQSFLHGVRQHGKKPGSAPHRQLSLLAPIESRPLSQEKDSRFVMFSIGNRLGELAAAAYRSLGYDAVAAGPGSPEVLARGRRDCSGKECLPYQIMWGAFKQHLDDHPPDKRTLLVQVTGQGACRNCMFSIKDRMSLERMGLGDRVAVRHFGEEHDPRAAFLARFWGGTVTLDILSQLAAYHRPLARDPATVDALDDELNDALHALVERPGRHRRRKLSALVERAARTYAALPRIDSDRELRTVLLTGDIYVRTDEFANDNLVRALNERKLRVILDPVCVFVEYLAEERSAELLGLPTGLVDGTLSREVMRHIRRALYRNAQRYHPWLPPAEVPRLLDHARPYIDRYPLGEAPITVGSVMHAWQGRACDGVVIASPWGCGPALVAEGLLRHEREIPMLFMYSDGAPADDRRLNGFAYRLRRAASRASRPATPPRGEAHP